MKKTLINVFLLVSVFCFFFSFKTAEALTISPARIELRGDPGTTIGGDIVLINDQAETKTFFASFENFVADGDSGTPKFVGDKEGLATWISTTEAVVLNQGEVKTIPFTVTIPANAKPGGYFSGIFWGSAPPNADEQGNVAIGTKLGILIFVSVNGDIEENAGISDFSTLNKQWGYRSLPVSFLYRLTNAGGDRIKPEGDVIIRSILGWRVAKVTANPTEGSVLPGTTRKFTTVWEKNTETLSQEDEKYSFFGEVKKQWKNFAVGIFRAKMNVTYGFQNDDVVKSNAVYFIVFPLEFLIVFFIIAGTVFLTIRFFLIRYHRMVMRNAYALLKEKDTE